MASARHLVVLAGADPTAVDALAAALRDDGTVRTAYSVDALFESLDAEVDVVLVDAGLPEGRLDAVLEDLGTRDVDCRVAVLSRDPDPVRTGPEALADAVLNWDEDAVREAVDRLAARARYRRQLDEYYELAEKRAALADAADDVEDEIDRLDRQLDRLRRDLAVGFRRLDDTSAFDAALSPDERALKGRDRTAVDDRDGERRDGDPSDDKRGDDDPDDGADASGQ